MRIELDIFSGKPNPNWEIYAGDVERLLTLESLLNAAPTYNRQHLPLLGYRGFLYGNGENCSRAFRGYVEVGSTILRDPFLTVERFLLRLLPGQYEALRKKVYVALTKFE